MKIKLFWVVTLVATLSLGTVVFATEPSKAPAPDITSGATSTVPTSSTGGIESTEEKEQEVEQSETPISPQPIFLGEYIWHFDEPDGFTQAKRMGIASWVYCANKDTNITIFARSVKSKDTLPDNIEWQNYTGQYSVTECSDYYSTKCELLVTEGYYLLFEVCSPSSVSEETILQLLQETITINNK